MANPPQKNLCAKLKNEWEIFNNNLLKENLNRADNQNKCETVDQFKFFLVILENTFAINQIWRFPVLAYQFGGTVFAIIFGIALFTVGNAFYFLEISLGQYTSNPPAAIFKMVPITVGLGYTSIIYSILFISCYTPLISYAIFYLASTLETPMPWTKCMNSSSSCQHFDNCNNSNCEYPSLSYWLDIDELNDRSEGGFESTFWSVMLTCILAFIFVFINLSQQPPAPGRMYMIMRVLFFSLLLILFYVSLSKEGAWEGIKYLVIPQWEDFFNIYIWGLAFEEAFYALGVGMSCGLTLGSYGTFSTASYIDCTLACFFMLFANLLCCSIVFSNIGILSLKSGLDFHSVISPGPAVLYVIYPEALSLLPGSAYFTILFFVSIIYIGTTAVTVFGHGVVNNINEIYPKTKNYPNLCNFMLLLCCFVIGVPILTKGGGIYFQIFDRFAAGLPLLIVAAFEVFAVSYCYGLKLFLEDVAYMTGKLPCRYYRVLWGVGGVFVLLLGISYVSATPWYIHHEFGWLCFGYFLWGLIVSPILIFGVIIILQNLKDIRNCFKPNHLFGPKCYNLKEKRRNFVMQGST